KRNLARERSGTGGVKTVRYCGFVTTRHIDTACGVPLVEEPDNSRINPQIREFTNVPERGTCVVGRCIWSRSPGHVQQPPRWGCEPQSWALDSRRGERLTAASPPTDPSW